MGLRKQTNAQILVLVTLTIFKVCQRCLRKDILFTENFLYDELFFFSFLFIGRFLCHIVYKSYV